MTDEQDGAAPGLSVSRRAMLRGGAVAGIGLAAAGPHEAWAGPGPGAKPAGTEAARRLAPVIMHPVRMVVNREEHTLSLDARTTLLDMLREHLHLTGSKKGCDHGRCSACTVLADGHRINACLSLAVMHDGGQVTTIEGLANGDALHPMQAAFLKHDGYQCGYCTPRQI